MSRTPHDPSASQRRVDAVVIGASAGAVEALTQILPVLPGDLQTPIVICVHLPPNRASLLAELFNAKCALDVREAEDKLPLGEGTVWFAPPGYHLLIEQEKTFALSIDEPVNYSRPSIDVLFESASDVFKNRLLGMVLTGANQDGAHGAKLIHEAGGLVAVQSPATAIAGTMPQFAIERAHPDFVGSLGELAAYLCRQAHGRALAAEGQT